MLMICQGQGQGEILTLTSDIDNIILQETPNDKFYTDQDICKLLNIISAELRLSIRFIPHDEGVYITGKRLEMDKHKFHQLTSQFRDEYHTILFDEDWEI